MVYKFQTIFLGTLTALMILTNGELSKVFGNAGSSVIIHLIGLAGCLVWLLLSTKAKRFDAIPKGIPLFEMSGGIIGYMTVWLTNASFMGLGVAATLALAIAGQTLFATVLDATGYLGVTRRQIKPLEFISLLLTLVGAFILSNGGAQ